MRSSSTRSTVPADLPAGRGAVASAGRYRLVERADARAVRPRRRADVAGSAGRSRRAYRSGSASAPHPASRSLRRPRDAAPLAFIGVRACELAAFAIQDHVFLDQPAVDADYQARRASAFVVAVECATPASTCFCTSMGTGPEATAGFDVAMTELDEGFVVRTGSPAGAALIASLELAPADPSASEAAAEVVAGARRAMGMPTDMAGVADGARRVAGHPEWAAVADRCLGCTNCTLVCPTCFCTSVVQRSDLDGTTSTAERTWDSCFSDGFAKVAGGSFRPRRKDRYRQWLTHKFSTWWDQFGSSGCVGCGRCIAWCPVGIDVREELAVIAGTGAPPDAADRTCRHAAARRPSHLHRRRPSRCDVPLHVPTAPARRRRSSSRPTLPARRARRPTP